jgi:uncharacterized protein (TIGR02300 family)
MSRPDLGNKCVCAGCSERFYDLRRVPPVCPKCGAEYTAPKPKAPRSLRGNVESRALAAKTEAAPADDVVEDDEEVEPVDTDDDDDDNDVIAIDPDREKLPE